MATPTLPSPRTDIPGFDKLPQVPSSRVSDPPSRESAQVTRKAAVSSVVWFGAGSARFNEGSTAAEVNINYTLAPASNGSVSASWYVPLDDLMQGVKRVLVDVIHLYYNMATRAGNHVTVAFGHTNTSGGTTILNSFSFGSTSGSLIISTQQLTTAIELTRYQPGSTTLPMNWFISVTVQVGAGGLVGSSSEVYVTAVGLEVHRTGTL